MNKLIVISMVLVLSMVALQASAAKMDKVEVCHVTDFNTLADTNPWTLVVGHWINVSGNSLVAHQAHGDFVYTTDNNDIDFGPVIFGLTWRQVAINNGLQVAGADCAGFVHDF